MCIENYRWLAGLIAAHPDRKVVGRTRLQKTVKLLQRLGFPTRYRYTLFFYGPYSEEVQAEIDLLDTIGLIDEKRQVSTDGTEYYVITAREAAELTEIGPYQEIIRQLAATDPVVLELAATYDTFRELGCNPDEALVRLRRKKGAKCGGSRDVRALQLVHDLGLSERQGSVDADQINSRVDRIMTDAFRRVLVRAQRQSLDLRTAALIEGIDRVAAAKLVRSLFP